MEAFVKKLWVLVFFLAMASTVFARKAMKIEILNDAGFATTDYSTLVLADVSAKDYLITIRDRKNYDDVADQVHEMNQRVRDVVSDYCSGEFQGGKTHRVLKMTMDLAQYNPGSAAAAMMVGFGAGSGSCEYEVHLWDKNKDVAGFMIRAGIQRWVDVSGEAGRARAPRVLLSEIRQFLDSH